MDKKVIVLIVAVLVIGAGAYGLTRNKKTDSSSTSSGSNTSQNSSANPANSSTNSTSKESSNKSNGASLSVNAVTISNFAFSPKDITVKKGTTVTWTNKDSVAHTVQENDGKSGPKSDDLAQGATYTYTYTAAGTFAYYCSIHPDMIGTVTVTE